MDVPARTVNVVLRVLRDVTGNQYPRLLEAAGLSRFLDQIPEFTADLVATKQEIEALFSSIYSLLGEVTMRLFLRNYGQLLARLILEGPSAPELRAGVANTPAAGQLAWFAHAMSAVSIRSWTPTTVSEDETAFYLTFARCPLCVGVSNVGTPICTTFDSLYGTLGKELLGRRVRVVEVECAAAGAAACKAAFYK